MEPAVPTFSKAAAAPFSLVSISIFKPEEVFVIHQTYCLYRGGALLLGHWKEKRCRLNFARSTFLKVTTRSNRTIGVVCVPSQ